MLTVIMNILIMALTGYKSSSIIQPCTNFALPKVETTKKKMNILKLLFLVLIHVSTGFRSLDDLEKFYKLRPSYDPYGTVSSMFYHINVPDQFIFIYDD